MSFDARSKERLEALGRTLPKKLPLPEPAPLPRVDDPRVASPGAGSSGATPQRPRSQDKAAESLGIPSAKDKRLPVDAPRHRLEREQDPAELFRALISASPDGTVPPHLLDRLRDLERTRLPAPAPTPGQTPAAASATRARTAANITAAPSLRGSRKGPKGAAAAAGNRGGSRTFGQGRASDDQDLYSAFAQLLLEDDGD
jgi:hypothetical protein